MNYSRVYKMTKRRNVMVEIKSIKLFRFCMQWTESTHKILLGVYEFDNKIFKQLIKQTDLQYLCFNTEQYHRVVIWLSMT